MTKKDALYAEAEAVFRRLVAEDERTYRAGGAKELSQEYKDLLGTDELKSQQLDVVRSIRSDGSTISGGHFTIRWLKRQPGVSRVGSIVSVFGCVDMSPTVFYVHGKHGTRGPRVIEYMYLRRYGESLRLSGFTFREVPSC